MGKQINYYMEYDSFLLLAAKAIELGCEVLEMERREEAEAYYLRSGGRR